MEEERKKIAGHEKRKKKKNQFISNMKEDFVESFEKWMERKNKVNNVIKKFNKQHKETKKFYSYDEFCRVLIIISDDFLERSIKLDDMFLTESEVEDIKRTSKPQELDEIFEEESEKKYKNFQIMISSPWHDKMLEGLLMHKVGEENYIDVQLIVHQMIDSGNF